LNGQLLRLRHGTHDVSLQVSLLTSVGWFSMSPLPRLHHHDIMQLLHRATTKFYSVPQQSFSHTFLHREKKEKNSMPFPDPSPNPNCNTTPWPFDYNALLTTAVQICYF